MTPPDEPALGGPRCGAHIPVAGPHGPISSLTEHLMRGCRRWLPWCLLLAACGSPAAPESLTVVQANDNRTPAGVLSHDTLRLRLSLRLATWRPEADSGAAIEVAAFAEDGRAPRIPAPLIRVPTGTVIVATVRNLLPDSTITLRGLAPHPDTSSDTVRIRPGDSTTVRFAAGAPGTYLYAAGTGSFVDTLDERETTGGAFVVDPVGGSPPDRIFVMNIWGHLADSVTYRNALTINGRSWPWDERIDATVGDSIRWRWVNATGRTHPMHMHGFFFRVDSHGNARSDSVYPDSARRLAVTEVMFPFETMAMAWSPDREGDWLFHCHIGWHVTPDATLEPPPVHETTMRMGHDPEKHMAGLVLGLRVHPRRGDVAGSTVPTRTLRLYVDAGKSRGDAKVGMGYVLQHGDTPPAADSIVVPGEVIVTTVGEPTDVVITNRMPGPTAVHWHGLEIESYSDGVAGWSGTPGHLAPVIAPGDSFVAHLDLRRAGTFIYHTHIDDMRQITSGLYGALLVLPPATAYDPAIDHVWVAGNDGLDAEKHRVVVNGDTTAPPLTLRAGVPHRMRLVNMGFALGGLFGVYRDTTFVPWRAIAKDGADLPASQAVLHHAPQLVVSGETYDFEWVPVPGHYRLMFTNGSHRLYSQGIVVR